jgi:hypothetical protein
MKDTQKKAVAQLVAIQIGGVLVDGYLLFHRDGRIAQAGDFETGKFYRYELERCGQDKRRKTKLTLR